MGKSNYRNIERRQINYDDDIVIVYDDNEKEIYRGIEDYEPMKDAAWSWENSNRCYRFRDVDGNYYIKICLDI